MSIKNTVLFGLKKADDLRKFNRLLGVHGYELLLVDPNA